MTEDDDMSMSEDESPPQHHYPSISVPFTFPSTPGPYSTPIATTPQLDRGYSFYGYPNSYPHQPPQIPAPSNPALQTQAPPSTQPSRERSSSHKPTSQVSTTGFGAEGTHISDKNLLKVEKLITAIHDESWSFGTYP